jgi:hypothetical protein
LGKAVSLEKLEARVAAMAEAVKKAAVPELARLRLDESPRAEALWARVEPVLTASEVHESYVGELLDLSERAARKGKAAQARTWLERAVQTHPGAVTPLLQLANALLAEGKADAGRARYREAFAALSAVEPTPEAVLLEHAQEVDGKKTRKAALEAAVAAAVPLSPPPPAE